MIDKLRTLAIWIVYPCLQDYRSYSVYHHDLSKIRYVTGGSKSRLISVAYSVLVDAGDCVYLHRWGGKAKNRRASDTIHITHEVIAAVPERNSKIKRASTPKNI